VRSGWKKWSFATSVSSFDFKDLKMGKKGPGEYLRPFYVSRQNNTDVVISNNDIQIQNPTAYSQINLMQKIRFKPFNRLDLQYGFHYSETSDYSRYDRHIRYKSGLPRYGEWNYGPQIWTMHNLKITKSGNHLLYNEITINSAVQKFEESRISRDFNKNNRETRTEKVNAYSINAELIRKIGEKPNCRMGVNISLIM
jgi:hemoglobin/transferrin/lactoferrin receptor protein